MKKIKIAQIIWPSTALPPKAYGSVQLVASRIIQNIDKNKFDLSVLTAANNKINAKIIPILEKPILDDKTIPDKNLYLSVLMAETISCQNDFDLIHSHIGHSTLVLAQSIKKPLIMTLHGDYSNIHFRNAYKKYGQNIHYVSISRSQQNAFPCKSELIYHGLPTEEYEFSSRSKDYAVYIGRTSPFKGLGEAIQIAINLKIKLKIAAKIDTSPEAVNYFKEKVKPYINNKYIEFLGEQTADQVKKMLKFAKVFLYPISWDEPFGLVVAEAQASGVPVVTYDRGAMREIIIDKKTGFVCDPTSRDSIIKAVEDIYSLSRSKEVKMRQAARENIQNNFSVEQMIKGYENIYKKILNGI